MAVDHQNQTGAGVKSKRTNLVTSCNYYKENLDSGSLEGRNRKSKIKTRKRSREYYEDFSLFSKIPSLSLNRLTLGIIATILFLTLIWFLTSSSVGTADLDIETMSGAAAVIVQPTAKHTSTLIFLHGLGDTGHGWSSSLEAYKPSHTKLICPHAPTIPVSLNAGMRMPSWFDLKSLDPGAMEDESGIKGAAQKVRAIIEQEIAGGIPVNRIVLGGFSMGGALALYTGLTSPYELGGIVALSSWLPLYKQFPYGGAAAMKKPPIFQGHGEADPMVIYSYGVLTSQLLKKEIPVYSFKSYKNLMHSSSEEELRDVREFLKKVLP